MHAALAVVAVLFSLNYIIGKIGLRHMNPFAFAWLRVAGSAALLWLASLASANRKPLSGEQRRRAVLYAVLGVCINQLMFLTGLSLTTATEAAILITTIPIFTLVGAVVLRTERATWINAVGITMAAVGALLIVGPKAAGAAAAANRALGDLFILINCASYGLFLVVSRPLFREHSALIVTRFLFTTGTLLMFPFCIRGLWMTEWSAVPPEAWLALVGVILGPTVGAYLLSAWALARAESSVVAAYTYVQPVLASLLAALLLGEVFRAHIVFAGILIIAGVALSSLRRPERVVEPETHGLT